MSSALVEIKDDTGPDCARELTSRFQISVFNQPQRVAILRNAPVAQNARVIIELIELSALWMAFSPSTRAAC
jgi:hypothetical protein